MIKPGLLDSCTCSGAQGIKGFSGHRISTLRLHLSQWATWRQSSFWPFSSVSPACSSANDLFVIRRSQITVFHPSDVFSGAAAAANDVPLEEEFDKLGFVDPQPEPTGEPVTFESQDSETRSTPKPGASTAAPELSEEDHPLGECCQFSNSLFGFLYWNRCGTRINLMECKKMRNLL